MTDLAPHLERLGLEQYLDAFIGEGFETWEILLDIQESDFDALNVKLGHRRKLQRAIADYRGISYERLIGSPAQEGPPDSGRTSESATLASANVDRGHVPPPETKRKYRRHPKPDENAPERPPSAYVIFSNRVREEVKDQNLSFTQIAKLVGDRWQKLDATGKEPFDSQANAAKERYNIQLSTYRKTDAYKEYMQYLAEFKAKHGQTAETKRPKLEPESSGSIISSRSLEVLPGLVSEASGHTRGGSIGSVASSPFTTVSMQSSIPATSSAPLRPPLATSRSGSPPSSLHTVDLQRPGLASHPSSISDESSTVRSELADHMMRTGALSLNTPSAGTPPLPSMVPSGTSSETMGSPDPYARTRGLYYGQHQASPAQPVLNTGYPGLSPTFGQPMQSPSVAEASWRNQPPDIRGYQDTSRPMQTTGTFNPSSQLSPSQLPPLITPERMNEMNHSHGLRTLPPPRPHSGGVNLLPHLGRGMEHPRPLLSEPLQIRRPGVDENRSVLDRSESDAASTLAGLAASVPRPDTTKPPKQTRPPH